MELEAKFRHPAIEDVEPEVRRLGFELARETDQTDYYYVVGEADDEGTRHYLRVREDELDCEHSIDYHRVLSTLETDEKEVGIDDVDEARGILNLLGHEVDCVVDKKREEYVKDDVSITLDHVEGLGDFVEIEMEGELSEEKRQTFDDLVERLELDDSNRVKEKGYPELVLRREQ